jgi:hypothetical protein
MFGDEAAAGSVDERGEQIKRRRREAVGAIALLGNEEADDRCAVERATAVK